MTLPPTRPAQTALRVWGVAGGVLLLVLLALWYLFIRTANLDGPSSPDGLRVKIRLSDRHFGPGADYYADVEVLDRDGREVGQWHDPDGQKSMEGAWQMVRSMRWTSPSTLEFQCQEGQSVALKIPPAQGPSGAR